MYKVLVVDDSALMRRFICDIINAENEFHVADVSADGLEAYNKITTKSYDFVILDMILPKMTGLELVERLQSEQINVKIIAISSTVKEDMVSTVQAMEYGVLDFVVKPLASTQDARIQFQKEIIRSMRGIVPFISKRKSAAVKPVLPKAMGTVGDKRQIQSEPVGRTPMVARPAVQAMKGKRMIALACSTGGPQALCTMVPMLPMSMNVPMVIVQHMPAGFTYSLAERLNQLSKVHVKEAEDGEILKAGWVYIAPGGRHLEIRENRSKEAYISLSDAPPVNSLRPCADLMYRSLETSSFDSILCVVLTGMGADGMMGITGLSKRKKISVISESEETCVVYGMPRAVQGAGLSDEVVPITEVANAIMKKLGV